MFYNEDTFNYLSSVASQMMRERAEKETPHQLAATVLLGVCLSGLLISAAGARPATPSLHACPASVSRTQLSTAAGQLKADQAVTRMLTDQPASGWVPIILKITGPVTPSEEAQIGALGGDIVRRLPIIRSVAVRVPCRSLRSLAALPFAAHLSLDGPAQKSDEFTVASSEAAQAAITKSGTTTHLTGQGITVAVVDSGMTPLPDLSGPLVAALNTTSPRILANVNFSSAISSGAATVTASSAGITKASAGTTAVTLNSSGGIAAISNNGNSYDPCGHGTHVAGIIAGNGTKSTGSQYSHTFCGIAPQANLVNVRVLDYNGTTSVSTVITGLQWIISNQSKYKIRVINLSLGHPVGESYTTDPLCQAVEAAYQAGIVVVCAAGNSGRLNGSTNTPGQDNEGWGTAYGSIQSPANDPYVITVGATKSMSSARTGDRIATYSSRGPSRLDLVMKPDIIAPGNQVISLDAGGSMLDTYDGGTNQIAYSTYVRSSALLANKAPSGDYFRLSGTSMAAPVVAGAVALLLEANPALTPDTIKARLMLSADKWLDPNKAADPLTYGAGYLNIPAALTNTVIAQGPAFSPCLTEDSQGNVSIVMNRAIWGNSLWGTGITDLRAIWGSSAVWSSSGVAANRAVWGANAIAASHAVWGSNVWADHAVWGSSGSAVDLTSTAILGE